MFNIQYSRKTHIYMFNFESQYIFSLCILRVDRKFRIIIWHWNCQIGVDRRRENKNERRKERVLLRWIFNNYYVYHRAKNKKISSFFQLFVQQEKIKNKTSHKTIQVPIWTIIIEILSDLNELGECVIMSAMQFNCSDLMATQIRHCNCNLFWI